MTVSAVAPFGVHVNAPVNVFPVLSNTSPAQGDVAGGTTLTLGGRGFATGNTSVDFGGAAGASVHVNSPTSLTVVAPASPLADGEHTGFVNVQVTVNGLTAAETVPYRYVVPFAPILDFETPLCGRATLDVHVFNAAGSALLNEQVTLHAVKGMFTSGSGTQSDLTMSTAFLGHFAVPMVPNASGELEVLAHSGHRPSPDEDSAGRITTRQQCESMHATLLHNLGSRLSLRERLVPIIVDGCRACTEKVRYRVEYSSTAAVLKGFSAVAMTNNPMIASDLAVSVVGKTEVDAWVKKVPFKGEVGNAVELRGPSGDTEVELTIPFEQSLRVKDYKAGLFKLDGNQWTAVKESKVVDGKVMARISGAGVFLVGYLK